MVVNLNPTLFKIGPLEVRWYGLMYVIGFYLGTKLLQKLSREKFIPIPLEKVDLFVTVNMIGMFLGARLFYIFFYNWDYYSQHVSEIFSLAGVRGLSFHGAIVGFILATTLFARKYGHRFFHLMDGIALAGTPGLFFGRMGNFINGELYGRITTVPWGMIFPEGGPYPRHPSQLYEGVGEGIILTALLWLVKSKVKSEGLLSGAFLFGYGVIRFLIEYVREPDEQLGLLLGHNFSMGQIFCFLMILAGIALMKINSTRQRADDPLSPPGETAKRGA